MNASDFVPNPAQVDALLVALGLVVMIREEYASRRGPDVLEAKGRLFNAENQIRALLHFSVEGASV